jgi:hypothetical protein
VKLIYLSPVHWNSYKQRPHFMIQSFLSKGIESVLWINPYPARLPRIDDFIRDNSLYKQGTEVPAHIHILSPRILPVEPLPVFRHLNGFFLNELTKKIHSYLENEPFILGIGRPVMLGCKLLQELSPIWSFYDAMDDFPEFYGGLSKSSLQRHESKISKLVDIVFVSSTYLKTKFAHKGLDPILLHNACQLPHSDNIPAKKEQNNVLGYVGAVASWFDWDLVCNLAKNLPSFRLRIIGPMFNHPRKSLPQNIEILPSCAHSETIKHICQFSAGLIPFKINKLTNGVDPIKYYEYRALGLPILSTRFGEMVYRDRQDGVFFLDQAATFSALVEEAIEWSNSMAKVDDTFYLKNNWSFRFSSLDI